MPPITPEAIVGSGGPSLGVYLVHTKPLLGMVSATMIAALVVVLYTLGVDGFCAWSANLRTDQEEK